MNDSHNSKSKSNRSRSRSKEESRTERRERRKVSKWGDAPSKFTSAPPGGLNSISLSNQIHSQKTGFTAPPIINQNSSLFNLNDNTKIKKKIYIPKQSGINYVGLLIGPKGTYQKRLEQQSGCKILVRGKGTQKEGMPPQPDDHEEQHVLIVGDAEDSVKRAIHLVEKILYADEETRTKIKDEQIKASKEIRTELLLNDGTIPGMGAIDSKTKPVIERYLMTPYGPPDKNARILPVPDDCVGLIIGKNGDTIRRLNRDSGCKIQIAIGTVPNSTTRNVFIEGPPEKYEIAKKLIEDIISEQIAMKQNYSHLGETNSFPGPHTPLKIPNKMVGLIIGRNGETVKTIHQLTGCQIFIPKESKPGDDFRELQLSGSPESVEICKKEIMSMIHLALYGRLPYMNSLFYPYIDPITRLPIIDPGIMAQLDPNTKNEAEKAETKPKEVLKSNKDIDITKKNEIKENERGKENINNENQNEVNVTNPDTSQTQQVNIVNPIIQNIPITQINQNINSGNINQINNKVNPINNYESFEQSIFLNSKTAAREVQYDLENYFNPLNYDLYFQSVYQMYPQLNDYYKKASTQSEIIGNSKSVPLVLLNTTLLEQNQNNGDNNPLENCMIENIQNQEDEDEPKKPKKNNRYKK